MLSMKQLYSRSFDEAVRPSFLLEPLHEVCQIIAGPGSAHHINATLFSLSLLIHHVKGPVYLWNMGLERPLFVIARISV